MRVAFDSIPEELDSANVNSATEFRLLLELTARLTSFDGADVKADLASRWKVNDKHTVFDFTLENDRKFSDGSTITVQDVVKSLQRSVSGKFGVHYDVEKIKSIEQTSPSSLRIRLREPDPFFLQDLSNPEFAILSKEDQGASKGRQSFRVTSGPLYINKQSPEALALKRNPHFQLTSVQMPDEIIFESRIKSSKDETVRYLMTGVLDYFWAPSLSKDQHLKLLASGYNFHASRNSYTYWISFNPASPLFRKLGARQALQKMFYDQKIDITDREPKLHVTSQLYHPDGPGRLTEEEIQGIYAKASKKALPEGQKLRILTFKGAFYNERVCAMLKAQGIICELKEISDFTAYSQAIESGKDFDVVIINNDFSSDYLKKNLEIALYKKRPLILLPRGEKELHGLMAESAKETDLKRIADIQKTIGRLLLERAYIVPLFYDTRIIYFKKSLDTSNWSTLASDFSLWKIKR